LKADDAPPPLLHPEMAGLYRQKVTALAQALEHPETRTEASEALRGLIDAIVSRTDRAFHPMFTDGASLVCQPFPLNRQHSHYGSQGQGHGHLGMVGRLNRQSQLSEAELTTAALPTVPVQRYSVIQGNALIRGHVQSNTVAKDVSVALQVHAAGAMPLAVCGTHEATISNQAPATMSVKILMSGYVRGVPSLNASEALECRSVHNTARVT
jgi:hypothetical protein